jgi:putative exosortase-associated protein (TIGR04073 family)
MRHSKLFQVFVAVLLALSVLVPPAFAGEGTAGDYFSGMGIQLGRGVWNIVSSPAEIPCTMRDDIKADGGVGAATGFGKGLAFFVRRVVVGVSEILTFVMPSEATMPMVCSAPGTSPQVAS